MKFPACVAGAALSALLSLTGCGKGPTIDASSDETFKASVQQVTATLDPETRKQFESALQTLLFAGFEGKNLFELSADAESGGMERRFKAALDGKTAAEVIAQGASIATGREDKGRQEASAKLAELERILDGDEQAAKQLAQFEVERSRFRDSDNLFSSRRVIELTVRNSTDRAVSAVTFDAALRTPGREIPWVQAPVSYSIPGGMEPGESDTWLLSPNVFGEWSSAPSDRHDMVLTVEVVNLEGADGKPIFTERFTRDDLGAARSAIEKAGAAESTRIAAKVNAWEELAEKRCAEEQRRQVLQEIGELERVESELAAFKIEGVQYVKPTRPFEDHAFRIEVTNGTPHTVLYANCAVRIFSPGREVPWAEGETLFRFDAGLQTGERGSDVSAPDLLNRVPFDERQDIKIEVSLLRLDDASGKAVVARKDDAAMRIGALRRVAPLL